MYQEEEKDIPGVASSIRAHNKEEILKYIKSIKKVTECDRVRMVAEISEEEVGITLKNTRNNISPGHGGFGGNFYKVFWK